jgi:hypothetical protein
MCFSGVFRKIAHEDCESIHAVAPSIEKKSVSSLPEGAARIQPTQRIWLCFVGWKSRRRLPPRVIVFIRPFVKV